MTKTEEHVLRQRQAIRRRKELAAKRLHVSTRAAVDRFEKDMSDVATEEETLKERLNDPVVLVNMQTWRYFHSAEEPCGRVTGYGRDISNFVAMFLSEAEAKHFEPCTACGHHALYEKKRKLEEQQKQNEAEREPVS